MLGARLQRVQPANSAYCLQIAVRLCSIGPAHEPLYLCRLLFELRRDNLHCLLLLGDDRFLSGHGRFQFLYCFLQLRTGTAHYDRLVPNSVARETNSNKSNAGLRTNDLARRSRFLLRKPTENPMSRPDQFSLNALASLGLTPREAEVLFWISQGKSNHDIGVILGAKTGTICKHVEHIFGKLNVENRTSAAIIAVETSRPTASISDTKPHQAWAAITGLVTMQVCSLWSGGCEFCDEIARLIA